MSEVLLPLGLSLEVAVEALKDAQQGRDGARRRDRRLRARAAVRHRTRDLIRAIGWM